MAGLTDLEKVQAAKHVADTIATPGWGVVVDLLEGRKAKLIEGLVMHSTVREQAEYARQLAEIRGADGAVDASRTVLRDAEQAAKRLTEGAS